MVQMGTFIGHMLPGAGFLILGVWHLFNTMGGYVHSPWHYKTRTWFSPRGINLLRHVELYFIIIGSCLSIAAELFICPENHQPWAEDWSIPTEHLNNFEHSTISFFLLMYATAALAADIFRIQVPPGWLQAMAALALSQELLLFHFHSADHMGLEGHYHWILQLPIAVGIITLLVEIGIQHLPVVAILRSMSLFLQGTWFIQMGFILWTPSLFPKGCSMVVTESDHEVVQCVDAASLMRAKAFANLQFSWHLAAIVVTTLVLYMVLSILQKRKTYQPLENEGQNSESAVFKVFDDGDRGGSPSGSESSMEMQGFDGLDLER